MTPFVKSCLLANKVQFIHLLADIGYPLHTFATEKIMEELFTVEAHKKTLGGQNLQMFLLSYRSKVPDIVTINLVRATLRKVMGRHCFTSLETHEVYHHSDFLFHGAVQDRNSMICTSSLADENGFQYLFVWALVTKRFQIAHFLLLHMTEICAAALFAAEFLRQMAHLHCTPSEREELERVAIVFEDTAVGILTECYLNNMETTMVLLVMERPAFGKLSALMLAARGYSYKFMEHSACQEYMNRVWLNTLAHKGNSLRFVVALIFGIVCPLAIPFIVEYDDSKYKSLQHETKEEFSNFEVGRKRAKRMVNTHIRKICDFYHAPCVRYSYNLLSYVLCLMIFTVFLQYKWNVDNSFWIGLEVFISIFFLTETVELVRSTFSDRHSRGGLFCGRSTQYALVVFVCFLLGTTLQALNAHYNFDVNGLEQLSRACLVFSATGPFLRLLMLFSINQNIGPKLQMIKHMLKKDMLPFLLILILFWLMFSVVFVTVIYRPGGIEDPSSPMSLLSNILRRNFFQMFGEFDSEENLQNVIHRTCTNNSQNLCSYSNAAYWIVALQSVFTLMTNLLLINLLIAIFTKRYDRMEAASQKLWAMQRYLMMDSLLRQAALPAPLVLFSHIGLIFKAIRNRIFSTVEEEQSPFRKSFRGNPARERQLIHWEKLRAVIYLAAVVEENHDTSETTVGFTAPEGTVGERSHSTSHSNSWKKAHRLANPVVTFREVLKTAEVRSSLEQKISTIHDNVSFIRNMLGKAHESAESHYNRGLSAPNTSPKSAHSTESLANAPMVFSSDGHWLAVYTVFSGDLAPHIFDEPVPWEEPLPSYHPIKWRPAPQCVPEWGAQELETPRVRQRLSIWSAGSSNVEIYVAQNPGGRVGIRGRGLLPELGPNYAYLLIIGAHSDAKASPPIKGQVLILSGAHRPAQFPWVSHYLVEIGRHG
uniref:Transient receptor potential cation channel subfamily M member 4 n=3 Tax=Schistocephalus solidus TaxID=70667 RepID=A0A0X3PRI9_SCHSO